MDEVGADIKPRRTTVHEATMSDELLNSESLAAWQKAAAKSAPGGNAEALNWNTPEGIVVKPLYTAADVKELLDLDSTTALVSPSEAGENATTSYLATNNCAESGSQDGFDQELHYSYCSISPCTMDFCSGYQIMYFYEEGGGDMVTVSGRQNP